MSLEPDDEKVLADLMALGAVPTSGHRSIAGQARAMAVNIAQKRDWIGKTYIHGAALQALVDEHSEWVTAAEIGEGLYIAMMSDPRVCAGLSHHLALPCSCFDLAPASINEAVRARIEQYQTEGVIMKVLWKEAGLPKCHVETAALPENKVEEA